MCVCVCETGQKARSDGANGYAVVSVLEEAEKIMLGSKKDELEKVFAPIMTRIYQENMPKDANGNPQVDPNMFGQMFGGATNGQNPFSGNPFQAGQPFSK